MPKIPMNFLTRKLTDFGDVTHVPSCKSKEWLIESMGVDSDRIQLIPHGVDTEKYSVTTSHQKEQARLQLGLGLDSIVAAYVGRFDHPKNEHWIAELATQMPDVSFVMMGSGPRRDTLNNAPVTILPYGDPLTLYRAMDALLVPSATEGFSLVTAEAMSTGRPVLRTRTDGVDETIVEGITGFSCPIEKHDFFTTAKQFLSDRKNLQILGHNAAQFARSSLAQQTQFDKTVAMYEAARDKFSRR